MQLMPVVPDLMYILFFLPSIKYPNTCLAIRPFEYLMRCVSWRLYGEIGLKNLM